MDDKPAPTSGRRVVFAGLIGNVMEWYDFAVYGYFASIIGRQFFPSDNPSVSLLAAFGAFAAGFLVRPLGGLVFGRIGDVVGRQRAMTLSVLAMAIPTVLIGLLPTYDMIGVAAPIAIVLLRIIQGLSVGGEYTSSLVFLAEHAKPNRRARTAIWGMWGATAGILMGSAVGAVVSNFVSDDQLVRWGWRLPFLIGAMVAVTGYLVRHGIHAPVPAAERKSPIRDTFGKHRMDVLRVALLNVGLGVGFYAAFVYAVTYIESIDKLPESFALDLNTGCMLVLLLILPMAAWLSDQFGRKPLLIAGGAVLTLGAVPFFYLMHTTEPAIIFLGECGFALGIGLLSGGAAGANVELMPNAIRCTGLAFAYNASIGLFGGTTPLIAAWLISITGNPISPAYWVAAACAVSLLTAIFFVRETRNQSLE
jgi:MHS family proline/betaine transporter-like MFS transporter